MGQRRRSQRLRLEWLVSSTVLALAVGGCAADVGSEDAVGVTEAALVGRPPAPPGRQTNGSPGGVNAWSVGVDHDWSWIVLGDLDADGRDDLCGLYGTDYGCVLNTGHVFGGPYMGADAFDGVGQDKYHSTIDILDVDGDGDGDLCGRTQDGIVCQRFNGSGFGPREVWQSAFRDAWGWAQHEYYSTIAFVQLHDITGAGTAPAVCGRGIAGIHCFFRNSSRTAFLSSSKLIPAFSDANGWAQPQYYETIQYADLDGDGFTDVCGRGISGIWCSRFRDGTTRDFEAPRIWTSQFRDAHGWTNPIYYASIRLGDINGDGRADICGRGTAGAYCGLSRGWYFNYTTTLDVPGMSNANGWDDLPLYYESLALLDYDGDGKRDVCGVGPHTKSSGLVVPEVFCARSTSSYWSPSFVSLGRKTGNAVVEHGYRAGRIHPSDGGYCWPSSSGGDVVCTNRF